MMPLDAVDAPAGWLDAGGTNGLESIGPVLERALRGLSRQVLRQVADTAITLLDDAEAEQEDLEPEELEECDDDEASLQAMPHDLVRPRVYRRAA